MKQDDSKEYTFFSKVYWYWIASVNYGCTRREESDVRKALEHHKQHHYSHMLASVRNALSGNSGAHLRVSVDIPRTANMIFLLVDGYIHIRDMLTKPATPVRPKRRNRVTHVPDTSEYAADSCSDGYDPHWPEVVDGEVAKLEWLFIGRGRDIGWHIDLTVRTKEFANTVQHL